MFDFDVRVVGFVRSEMIHSHGQPHYGYPALIEVLPEYVDALRGIENSTHIIVIGWLHEADRSILQVHRPSYDRLLKQRGVFACRSPVRPNPLGITTVRLLNVDGNILHVDGLDMVDGTPVLDLKPHSSGFDGVFSARAARDLSRLADPDAEHAHRSMLREAENFHGERCSGIAMGARMMYHTMKTLIVAQKDPRVVVTLGKEFDGFGCIVDAVQALSGATFGNNRLMVGRDSAFCFAFDERRLTFMPKQFAALSVEEAFSAPIGDLFDVRLLCES